jgi:hybrid cluster-associated redox disulfide protein
MTVPMFQPDTIVADALTLHPKARWVFAAYHIGGCNGCERAPDETLEQVATGYGIPLEKLLGDLNSLLGVRRP